MPVTYSRKAYHDLPMRKGKRQWDLAQGGIFIGLDNYDGASVGTVRIALVICMELYANLMYVHTIQTVAYE